MKSVFSVCLTGGPGAGKTAVTEVIRREYSQQFLIVPESASLLYGAQFPRGQTREQKRWAQKAIFHVQDCHEQLVRTQAKKGQILLCDRGTIDGLAYWPGTTQGFFHAVHSTLEQELARYDLVIHMESAAGYAGYDFSNPLRTESERQARDLDKKMSKIWSKHPRRYVVRSRPSFVEKMDEVIAIVHSLVLAKARQKRK
jgi:predicted ATPase